MEHLNTSLVFTVIFLFTSSKQAVDGVKIANVKEPTRTDGVGKETDPTLREGDIETPPGGSFRFGITYEGLKWPGGSVPYEIDPAFSPQHKQIIEEQMKLMNRMTYTVQFKPHQSEDNWLFVKLSTRCSSYVGMIGGEQITRLAPKCVEKSGIVVHELMHTLGFYHEQNRPDRDKYVMIMWGRINDVYKWNFRPTDVTGTSTFGLPYDYGSIMHFGGTYFARNKGERTIYTYQTQNPIPIGQRDKLSIIDVQKIRAMYGKLRTRRNLDGPQTCREAFALTSYPGDGEYLLFVGSERKPATIFCKGNKEYVSLWQDTNFSFKSDDNGDCSDCGKTTFHKIRIDPKTLEVRRDDYTFTASTRKPIPYGVAGGCKGRYQTTGEFRMNLNKTQFAFADNVQPKWKTNGRYADIVIQYMGYKKITGLCGGQCSSCMPEAPIVLKVQ